MTILILLLIGQISSEGESTKSKILYDFTLHLFHPNQQWTWALVLILLKAIFLFLRHYSLQQLNVSISRHLQFQWIYQHLPYPLRSQSGRQFSQYGRSFVKGQIIWWSDISLLLIIFIALSHLHLMVALIWLLFLLSSVVVRRFTIGAYARKKNIEKSNIKKYQEKFKFLLNNKSSLTLHHQWEKDIEILQKRASKSLASNQSFALQKAFAYSFFPLYFFSFLFLLASPLFHQQIEKGALLQLILILLYSQSAMNRCFKAPESWKYMQKIKDQLNSIQSKKPTYIDFPWSQFYELQKNSFLHLAEDNLVSTKLREAMRSTEIFRLEDISELSKWFAFYLPHDTLIGETYLAAVTSGKEHKTLTLINKITKDWNDSQWASFPWKSKIQEQKINIDQLAKLQLIKALCHPAKMILIQKEVFESFSIEQKEWLTLQIVKNDKKSIVI